MSAARSKWGAPLESGASGLEGEGRGRLRSEVVVALDEQLRQGMGGARVTRPVQREGEHQQGLGPPRRPGHSLPVDAQQLLVRGAGEAEPQEQEAGDEVRVLEKGTGCSAVGRSVPEASFDSTTPLGVSATRARSP